MKAVYKYEIDGLECAHDIPGGATLLHVGVQRGQICAWLQVVPDAEPIRHYFQLFGTGHPVPNAAEYLGTVLLADDALVLHLYEVEGFGAS